MGEARARRAKGLPPRGKVKSEPQGRRGWKAMPIRVMVPMELLVLKDGSIYDRTAVGLHRVTDTRIVAAVHGQIRQDHERLRQLAAEEAKKREEAAAEVSNA